MRGLVLGLVLALVAAVSIASSAVSALGSPASEGVHGAGVRAFAAEFGGAGEWRFAINAKRLPNGGLVGNVMFTIAGFDALDTAGERMWGRPVLLQTTADMACVVAEVERVQGDAFSQTVLQVFQIRDVPGGPDLIEALGYAYKVEPTPSLCEPPRPPIGPFELTSGNFTIVGS